MQDEHGCAVFDWADFRRFIDRVLASTQPERVARHCYAELRQVGSVREQSQIVGIWKVLPLVAVCLMILLRVCSQLKPLLMVMLLQADGTT